ncbi:expressed unknown protein [Seminavis robusta]|uniref:Uncharacterized protein n=1 Tax=Seminavis robusta TaxID=568900 RepID=A0A9N8EFU5_9STRA|nr:expressed unknown protein [Seminavis robusta]|eukprot:Sro881_g215280.1 n/a (369) ;mRNA; f:34177-35385
MKDTNTTITTNGEQPTVWKPQLRDKSVVDKLFSSKEERHFIIPHIHKILGVSCLVSFAYRYAHLGATDGNFGPNFGTLCFILLHFSLHASSFIFDIPKKRIREGYRIWPEFRWHAMGFTSRSLAFMLLMWQEQMNGISHRFPHKSEGCYQEMDLVIVLATCAFADFGSTIEHHSNTIRGVTFTDPFEQWYASEVQIYLTAYCIVGYRRYTLHLLAISIIQCNAFMMTMRRKNVASQTVLTAIYSLMLVGALVGLTYDDRFSHRTGVGATFGGVASILRLGCGVNKYLLWTVLWCVWYYIRTNQLLPYFNTWFWLNGMIITLLISTILGFIKRSRAPKESRSSVVAFVAFAVHAGLLGYLYWMNFVRPR